MGNNNKFFKRRDEVGEQKEKPLCEAFPDSTQSQRPALLTGTAPATKSTAQDDARFCT
jgi:hypothetical protein